MTTILFLAAIVALTLEGLVICRLPIVARLDVTSRLAAAFATGLVINNLLLHAESALGIEWSRVSLYLPALVIIAFGIAAARKLEWHFERPGRGWIPIAIIFLLFVYGAATARLTSGDLLFFWGPKAIRFAEAGKIDMRYLEDRSFFLAHPDYPLLLPMTYDWGITASKKFSWVGAVLLLPLFFFAAMSSFRGFARLRIGEERSLLYATLFTAVVGAATASAMVAGAADMILVFFAMTALSALTFADEDRGALVIASIALLGCVMVKVEGSIFSAIIIFAFAVTRRRFITAALIYAPAAIFITGWVIFAKKTGIVDSYSTNGRPIRPDNLGVIVRTMIQSGEYSSFYLPWIATFGSMITGRAFKRAVLPLIAGAGCVGWLIWVYLHGWEHLPDFDPTYWIASTANRVMLTGLASLVVATTAMNE